MEDNLVQHNQLARYAMWQLERAKRRGSVRRINKACRAFEHVLTVMSADHPDRPACMTNLGASLRMLYTKTESIEALDRLVQLNELIVANLDERHLDRVYHRSNLQMLLAEIIVDSVDRTELRPGRARLLNRLVPLAREAANDSHDRAVFLEALAVCLEAAVELTPALELREELVAARREQVASYPAGDPDTAGLLATLGAHLRSLAEATGNMDTFEEAVQIGEDAVEVCSPDDESRAMCLSSLGCSLHALFMAGGGSPATLREAVAVARTALDIAQARHPDRAACLNNLAIILRTEFEATRALDTLREAVRLSREAVELAGPDESKLAAYLATLSSANQELFKRSPNPLAIVEAVAASRRAVELTPSGSRARAGRLSDLANALHIMLAGSGHDPRIVRAATAADVSLLREALELQRAAVNACGPDDVRRGAWLNNLSLTARTLFEVANDAEALEEALQAGRDAVAASAPGSVSRHGALFTLIRALALRPAEPGVLQDVRRCCEELRATAVPRLRVLAHIYLGRAAMSGDSPQLETALAAYEEAVNGLPEVAPRYLIRADREHLLGELAGLPAEAASVALGLGRPEHALLLLEQARGVLLRESMGSRGGHLGKLHQADPQAAEEFIQLRDLLDSSDQTGIDLYSGDVSAATDHGARARRHEEVGARWQDLLRRIRRLPGMADFLRPPTIATLRPHPVDGPIVLVNASRFRCDALIVRVDAAVSTVELDCDYDDLRDLARAFQAVVPDVSVASAVRPTPDEPRILRDLAWLWGHVVKPILADQNLLSSTPRTAGEAPRIWWCPIGVTAFLPFHAAGHYAGAGGGPGATALDLVVSSYTSTINALQVGHDREFETKAAPATTPTSDDGVLIVEVSQLDGAVPLPGARAEAERIAQLVPNPTTLAGPAATRDAVLAALPRHRIAHFACHALTDPRSPALSSLLLDDYASAPLTSLDLSTSHVPHGELAFLSACETARSNEALADEAVHIATAYQLAGYRHVVGTLWPVADSAAGRLADDFYTGLAPSFDSGNTARMLHRAVCRLRSDAPNKPSRWSAHIHIGN